jgi:hypothetical protein
MEKVTLTIVFDPSTGQVAVSGPIQNRMLSYAMLKLAEKAIDELHAKAKAEGIVPVHGNGEEILRHIGRR